MKDDKYCYDIDGNFQLTQTGTQSSRLTLLLYLNDDFKGGHTTYYLPSSNIGVMNTQAIIPRMGCIAFFPHGDSKTSLLHEGSNVTEGSKYILRSEVLYKLPKSLWNHNDEIENN
jgi:hypothetical protein